MRLIIAPMALALSLFLAGCMKSKPTPDSEAASNTNPPPNATQPKSPQADDSTPSLNDDLDKYGPWVKYDDPAFTAEFPAKTNPPKRDASWEKQKNATYNTKDTRVVLSRAGDFSCMVTVYSTLVLPDSWEKDPDEMLKTYLPDRKDYPVKTLKVDGKFPARHTVGRSPAGGTQVYRVMYAHKRLYILDINSLLIKSDEHADVKRFLNSFKPKP